MSFAKPEKQEADTGGSLMCSARNCPNRWSVKTESPLCSYHAWEPPARWPSITESLRRSGLWALRHDGESPAVRDMKTRVRKGHQFTTLLEKAA